jgi:hypothetical protein
VPCLFFLRVRAVALRATSGGVLAVICGCEPATAIRPGDIRTYTIPRDAEPVAIAAAQSPANSAPPGGPGRTGSPPGPTTSGDRGSAIGYEVPEGWNDGGASGMRLATVFIGAPADKREVTIIPASGTLAGNVERWQGQLDAAATPESLNEKALAAIAAAETIDVAGTTATVVLLRDAEAEADAEAGQAILGAMIPVDENRALFVKFKGDAAVAARERERFSRFVSSIRWKE